MKFTCRPVVMGKRGVLTSGHYLATAAGFRIMEQGGNAIDAAAAVCFCLNILEPHANGVGGEVPTLIYSAKEKKAYAISGQGWSPESFTIQWCKKNNIDLIPGDGYLPVCVPSIVGTWTTALARFGTMSFSQIISPAFDLAQNGFPLYEMLHEAIVENKKRFLEIYPSTASLYCPRGKVPETGEIIKNPDLAKTFKILCNAEKSKKRKGRISGIEAVRDTFYSGIIAERIVKFIEENPVADSSGRSHKGMLSCDDFALWRAKIEDPVSYNYRGLDVHKCPSWTQGPVFLQQLALLEGYNLKKMEHNSADYLHTIIEAAKLAFADRETYYGDPDFDDVPLKILLSKKYNDERRKLIGKKASFEMRPGNAGTEKFSFDIGNVKKDNIKNYSEHIGDTTHLDAIDIQGNMVASTPSGGWFMTSPVIKGVGFPLGTRGQMFYLNPKRPNALQPRKRPRATLTPSLVTKNGAPFMVFGTPGGDAQDQWTLQVFLNIVDFRMNLQEALDAPTVHSIHFPSSFYPRTAFPGHLHAENLIPKSVIKKLEQKGHKITPIDAFSNGKPMLITIDNKKRTISGAVSTKGVIGYALSW